jgi:hypothetical protein
VYFVLVGNPKLPVGQSELIEHARRSGRHRLRSTGIGGNAFNMEQFGRCIDLLHVPQGRCASHTGSLSGEVQVASAPPSAVLTRIKSGRARAAVTSHPTLCFQAC